MKAPAVHGLHGFVLHDACWNLLQRFPGASDLSLERLLSVCESLPFLLWLNGLGWGHNYEGLFRYWPEGFYPWLEQFRVTGPDSEFAGYLFEENEQFFDVVALHGLRVAMGRNGLRALQLVGPEQHTSRWAGRTEEVPISERLVVNRQITNLRVTLDGYKITAIAVHAKQPDEGENMAAQAASLRHTEIWYPDIPPENLLLNEDSFIGSDTPSTVYEPLSWILFGGDRGDKLPFVRGLLYTHVDGLRGLQFEYDDTADETCRDASPVRLGHFEDRQPPFSAPLLSIKGARGERICSLSIGLASLEYDARPGLLRHGHPEHFAITTNKGRIKKIGKRTEMMKMHEITVASGTTITGLYGHFDLECGMVNIGVISERL
ncbi:hypothetical protein V2A60_004434 [Cordyceps javanica]